ncbi:unnamed protein product [Lymnaea stagnalis]|uniref:Uncharacterized protein n=1 Tax=Lymnaea stagnalis TaxID=6523 RepID=A0AAV2H578_LYMST
MSMSSAPIPILSQKGNLIKQEPGSPMKSDQSAGAASVTPPPHPSGTLRGSDEPIDKRPRLDNDG